MIFAYFGLFTYIERSFSMIKISTLEKNFSKILNELIDEKDLTDTTVAKKASIDRGRLGDY